MVQEVREAFPWVDLIDLGHIDEPAAGQAHPERRRRRGRRGGGLHRRPRVRWERVAVLVVVVAAIAWGLTDDLTTQVRLHHTEVEVTNTRADLATFVVELQDAQGSLARLVTGEHTNQAVLNQVEGELAVANQRLAQARQGLAESNFANATIKTCIAGTEGAIGQIQAGQQEAAIGTIAGVATACESLEAPGPGGPVYPFDFPDPDVVNVGGTYFGYGTNAAGGNIQIIQSSDLTHWSLVGDAIPQLPRWADPGATWAPGVLQLGHTFVMFYATDDGSTECISVAVASAPTGPFVDHSGGPIICQVGLGGSIDPSPFLARSGAPYLTWKTNGGSGQPATIWSQPLAPSGTALAAGSSPVALLQPSQAWEGHVVEGPFMWIWNGGYYLFYSGNNWETGSYAEGVAVCSGPLGPCRKVLAGPILASAGNVAGPGGATVFDDAAGNPWIAFHGWLPGAIGYPNARLLFLRRLTFVNSLPQVAAPS